MAKENSVMKAEETTGRFELYLSVFLLTLISGMMYLLFIRRFGYFNDDWYLMYAAGANGPSVFWDIFSVDRPLRALVMIPAYTLFGANPLYTTWVPSCFGCSALSPFCGSFVCFGRSTAV